MNSAKPVFKIFVGSIPGQIDEEVLREYFESFGPVERVRMFHRGQGALLNKGYCHLILTDEKTYANILDEPIHKLGERRIFCSTFISGRKLQKHNVTSNSKRIVVRDIPICFNDKDMYSVFGQFGKVTMAYIFISPNGQENDSRVRLGSVQYSDAAPARALAKLKFVEVRRGAESITLMVMPYVHNYGEPFGNPLREDIEFSFLEEDPAKSRSKKQGFLSTQEMNINVSLETPNKSPRQLLKESKANPKTRELKVAQVTLRSLPIFHSHKPTRKAYYLAAKGFRAQISNEDNLRFNQMSLPQPVITSHVPTLLSIKESDTFVCKCTLADSPPITRAESGPTTARKCGFASRSPKKSITPEVVDSEPTSPRGRPNRRGPLYF